MVMMRRPMTVEFTLGREKAARARHRRVASARVALALAAAAVAFPCETPAQVAGTRTGDIELVSAGLVSDASSIAPGQPLRLAVRLKPNDGWHLNWLNPGDAGLAPSVKWSLPKGFTAGVQCWPLPERHRAGPLVIFGYSGELLLVIDVRPPAGLAPGNDVEFRADVSWLACKDACVPGTATVSITLPVEPSRRLDGTWGPAIDASLRRCPQPSGMWNVAARLDDAGTIALDIQNVLGDDARIDDVFFFPYEPGLIENAAPQRLSVLASPTGRAAYQLRVELSRMAAGIPPRLSGILVSRSGWSDGKEARAIAIDVPLERR